MLSTISEILGPLRKRKCQLAHRRQYISTVGWIVYCWSDWFVDFSAIFLPGTAFFSPARANNSISLTDPICKENTLFIVQYRRSLPTVSHSLICIVYFLLSQFPCLLFSHWQAPDGSTFPSPLPLYLSHEIFCSMCNLTCVLKCRKYLNKLLAVSCLSHPKPTPGSHPQTPCWFQEATWIGFLLSVTIKGKFEAGTH